jgi:hypothetical protein
MMTLRPGDAFALLQRAAEPGEYEAVTVIVTCPDGAPARLAAMPPDEDDGEWDWPRSTAARPVVYMTPAEAQAVFDAARAGGTTEDDAP